MYEPTGDARVFMPLHKESRGGHKSPRKEKEYRGGHKVRVRKRNIVRGRKENV